MQMKQQNKKQCKSQNHKRNSCLVLNTSQKTLVKELINPSNICMQILTTTHNAHVIIELILKTKLLNITKVHANVLTHQRCVKVKSKIIYTEISFEIKY